MGRVKTFIRLFLPPVTHWRDFSSFPGLQTRQEVKWNYFAVTTLSLYSRSIDNKIVDILSLFTPSQWLLGQKERVLGHRRDKYMTGFFNYPTLSKTLYSICIHDRCHRIFAQLWLHKNSIISSFLVKYRIALSKYCKSIRPLHWSLPRTEHAWMNPWKNGQIPCWTTVLLVQWLHLIGCSCRTADNFESTDVTREKGPTGSLTKQILTGSLGTR